MIEFNKPYDAAPPVAPAAASRDDMHGDTLTLADIDAVIAHDMAMIAQPNGAQGLDLAALAVWSERCSQLPAFDKTRWKA